MDNKEKYEHWRARIGETILFAIDRKHLGCKALFEITDAAIMFDRVDITLAPVGGVGEIRVNSDRIAINPPDERTSTAPQ